MQTRWIRADGSLLPARAAPPNDYKSVPVLVVVTGTYTGTKYHKRRGETIPEMVYQDHRPERAIGEYDYALGHWLVRGYFGPYPRVACWTPLPDLPPDLAPDRAQAREAQVGEPDLLRLFPIS